MDIYIYLGFIFDKNDRMTYYLCLILFSAYNISIGNCLFC